MSARLMRRILVDFARSKGYQKRGGGGQKVTLDDALLVGGDPGRDLVALDDALDALPRWIRGRVRWSSCAFSAGLAVQETAEVLKVPPYMVMRDWSLAKVWLMHDLRRDRTR
jgi:hypothetical protein